jgi:hypothetical protein
MGAHLSMALMVLACQSRPRNTFARRAVLSLFHVKQQWQVGLGVKEEAAHGSR